MQPSNQEIVNDHTKDIGHRSNGHDRQLHGQTAAHGQGVIADDRIEALIDNANISPKWRQGSVLQRLAFIRRGVAPGPRLHDGRVQVEIVRHHRGADDAHGKIEHVGILHDFGRRGEAADQWPPFRMGQCDLHRKSDGDDAEQASRLMTSASR